MRARDADALLRHPCTACALEKAGVPLPDVEPAQAEPSAHESDDA